MKRRTLHFLLSALLVSLPLSAADVTLEEVLDGYYEAIGGLEAWQKVDSCRVTGRIEVSQGMESRFTMTFQRPLKSRMEVTTGEMTRVQAFDGEKAWMVVPFAGSAEPQILDDEFVPMMREQSDFSGPLIDWQAKGHQVELVGSEEGDEGGEYHLQITLDDGSVRHWFLNKETYLPVRFEATTEFMGDEVEVETVLDDYRAVGDLMMAHSVWTGPRGAVQGQTIEIEKIELDVTVNADFFAVPGSTGSVEESEVQE